MDAFRLGRTPVTNAQYGAFVRATGQPAARRLAGWDGAPRSRAASRHVRVVGRGCRLLPLGRRLPPDRGAVGACRTRRRPPHVAVGRRPTATCARRARAHRHAPGGRAGLRGGAVRPSRPCGERLGVDVEPPPRVPLRPRRRARGRRPGQAGRARRGVHPRPGRGALLVPARDAARDGRPLRRLSPGFGARGRRGRDRAARRPGGDRPARERRSSFARRRAHRRGAAAHVRGRGRRAHGDAGDERAVRGVRRRDRDALRRSTGWTAPSPWSSNDIR